MKPIKWIAKTVLLSKITRWDKNPRKFTDKGKADLRKSIGRFGLADPLILNADYGLIGGHARLDALMESGAKEAACMIADRQLTDKERDELGIRLNKNVAGEFDMAAVLGLADVPALLDMGFTADELGATATEATKDAEPQIDKAEELNKVWNVKTGDMFAIGDHRLLCGDSTKREDVESVMGGAQINIAFTSPPYASQRDYDPASGFQPIPPDEYVAWFRPIAKNVQDHFAHDGSWFVNIKASSDGLDTFLYVFDLVIAHVREWGWHLATEFCWERNGVPKSVTQRFKNQFEPVYQFAMGRWKMRPDAVRHYSDYVPRAGGHGVGQTSWKTQQGGNGPIFGAAKKRKNGRNGGSPSDEREQGMIKGQMAPGEYIGPGMAYPGNRLPTFCDSHKATGHTAAYPVGLPSFFIKAYTDENDNVYDPFLGSGSTMIAAQNLSRKCYGIEISPAYCAVILQRMTDAFPYIKIERIK